MSLLLVPYFLPNQSATNWTDCEAEERFGFEGSQKNVSFSGETERSCRGGPLIDHNQKQMKFALIPTYTERPIIPLTQKEKKSMISPNEGRSRISRRRQKKQKKSISPIRTRNVDAIIRSPEEQPNRSNNSQFSDKERGRERESLRVLTSDERERKRRAVLECAGAPPGPWR